MDLLAVLFRLLHIVPGALWVGAGALLVFVLDPLVPRMGQKDAHTFTRHLYLRSIFGRYFPILGGVATLAGFLLYGVISAHKAYTFDSPAGIVFHVGVVAGLLAAVWGGAREGRLSKQLARLSAEQPTAANDAAMAATLQKLAGASRIGFVLLLVAVSAMSSARYLY